LGIFAVVKMLRGNTVVYVYVNLIKSVLQLKKANKTQNQFIGKFKNKLNPTANEMHHFMISIDY